ncbi:hypothetical protein Bbelb_051400 [Branchiostoma belcheri]|nr:hypothetical protein Bbelb_051400 [Branchiostoma belcheri]
MCTQSAPSDSWVDIMDSIVDFDLEIDLLAAETSNFADQFMEHVGIDLEQFSTQPDPFLEPDPEKVKTEAPSETNVSLQPRFAALISTEKRCTPLLKANHKKSCLQYAEPSLSNPQTFWYTVLWTDDSSLVLWIRRFVQHRRNQACTEKNTLSTVKHGGVITTALVSSYMTRIALTTSSGIPSSADDIQPSHTSQKRSNLRTSPRRGRLEPGKHMAGQARTNLVRPWGRPLLQGVGLVLMGPAVGGV